MTMPAFDLRIVRTDRGTRIAPRGELDLATAPQLEEAVRQATSDAVSELVLDLRELTFLDSSGLRVLAQARQRADQAGTELSIWRGSRQIDRVLEISGLGPLLPLADAPEE